MNLRHRSILRTHGYTTRHIKAYKGGAVEFHEFTRSVNKCKAEEIRQC